MKKYFQNKRNRRGFREFLYILPFLILVAVFSYYPLYGWVYAFFECIHGGQSGKAYADS